MALSADSSNITGPGEQLRARQPEVESGQSTWLHWFCKILPDTAWFALFWGDELAQRTHWPEQSNIPANLLAVANQAASLAEPCQCSLPHAAGEEVLAIPLKVQAQSLVLILPSSGLIESKKQLAVRLARWASHWLVSSSDPIKTGIDFSMLSNHLLDDYAQRGSADSVFIGLVNAVADQLGSQRVSLAAVSGTTVSMLAISGQAKVDSRRQTSRLLADAMQEIACNDNTTLYNSVQQSDSLHAHRLLHQSNGGCSVFGISSKVSVGAKRITLLIEHPGLSPAMQDDPRTIADLQTSLSFAAVMANSNRSLLHRVRDVTAGVVSSIRQKRYLDKHVLVGICSVLAIIALLLPVPHRVTVRASIEAADRQVLVAPQAGYVLSSHARAGDSVTQGMMLATLDDSDLQLVAKKWQGEKQKNQQEYAKALAEHDRVSLSRLRADALRIDAELALAQQQLERSELRAPFDGVLLSGDLSQALGSPVEEGDVLFEIGSTETYRLLMDVDEHDIAHINKGQSARIRMTALPGQTWEARLNNLLPVAIAQQGQSVFRVPADILGESDALQPGMAGVGKVSVGSRSLIWVVTHAVTDRVRIWAWKLGLIR